MRVAWPKVKLGEVVSPAVRAEAVKADKEYRLLGVRLDGRGPFLRETLNGAASSAARLFQVRSGDFIYSRLFAGRGAFGIVDDELDGCFVSGEFPTFTPSPEKLDARFLSYWFRLPRTLAMVDENCSGSTPLTRNRFKENFFLALEIPLPPLAEQQRIVARIEALAGQIREVQRLRQEAVEQADALRGMSAKIGFDGDWPRARLEDVCEIITDGTHQTPQYVEADGYTFLSAQNIKPFRFMPETHRKVSYEDYIGCQKRVKPQKGDVLLTRVGAGIGEAAVIDRDIDFAFYVSLALIRPSPEKLLPELLTHWLNSPEGIGQSRGQTLGKGHSQGNLNLKLLRGFDIPVPSLEEQRRIVAELDALQAQVDTLKRAQAETAAELDALFPAILDKAFRGEL